MRRGIRRHGGRERRCRAAGGSAASLITHHPDACLQLLNALMDVGPTSRILGGPHSCSVILKRLILSSMKLFAGAPEVHGETHVPDLITSLDVHLRELMRHLGTMSPVMSSSGSSDVSVRDGEFDGTGTHSSRNSSRMNFNSSGDLHCDRGRRGWRKRSWMFEHFMRDL